LDLQILQKKLDRKVVIRFDASDLRRSDNDYPRTSFGEKAADALTIRQVQFRTCAGQEIRVLLCLELTQDGAPGEASMAGDENGFGL